jgi:hypothetical protein
VSWCGPVFQLVGDAEAGLVGLGQREQCLVHAGQVRGPAVVQGEVHARQ